VWGFQGVRLFVPRPQSPADGLEFKVQKLSPQGCSSPPIKSGYVVGLEKPV